MPHKQGELDSLCGVYSIANALEYLNAGDGEEVFEQIIEHMQRYSIFHRGYIIDGLKESTINSLLKVVKNNFEIRFTRHTPDRVTSAWKILTEAIDGNACAIIQLDGRHEHWTVVTGITEKRVSFLDSGGLEHLNRCDFGHDQLHQIRSIFIITR